MPFKPIDYNNTCFYKIVCKDLNIKDCYVGHTTDFVSRKSKHKSNSNNEKSKYYNFYVYEFIREHGGFDNFDMILIDKLTCTDRLDALKKEREYIESLGATLNKQVPTRTQKEYRESHKEVAKEYSKEYRIQHKKYLNDKKKDWYEENKDRMNEHIICLCGGKYTKCHKNIHLKTKKHQQYIESLNKT